MHNDAIFNGQKGNCKLYSRSSFILESEGGSTLSNTLIGALVPLIWEGGAGRLQNLIKEWPFSKKITTFYLLSCGIFEVLLRTLYLKLNKRLPISGY